MSNVVGPSLEPWFSTKDRSIGPADGVGRPRFGNGWGDMRKEDMAGIIISNKVRYIAVVVPTIVGADSTQRGKLKCGTCTYMKARSP